MTSIILKLTGAKAQAAVDGPLTAGMVGIPVTIECDDAWEGLTKNLVCRCGEWGPDRGETRMIRSVENVAVVAHEVMQADKYLYLGVEGYSADGKLVIPSTWADCGKIQHGADAGADPSTNPRLPFWAQLQTEIRQIKDHTVTEDQVTAIIEEYLEENPIEVTDPDQNAAPGSGMSTTAANLLIAILRDGVFNSDQSANITALKNTLAASDDGGGTDGDTGGDSGEDTGGDSGEVKPANLLYSWDFTSSVTDSVSGKVAAFGAQLGAAPTRDSSGVHFTANNQYIDLGEIFKPDITIKIDFGVMERQGTNHSRVLSVGTPDANGGIDTGFMYRNTGYWSWYKGSWSANSPATDANVFSEKTLKAYIDSSGIMTVYANEELVGVSTVAFTEDSCTTIQIGSNPGSVGSWATYYNMTVLAVRIYEGEV